MKNEFEKASGALKLFYNFGEHDITDGFHSTDHNYGVNIHYAYDSAVWCYRHKRLDSVDRRSDTALMADDARNNWIGWNRSDILCWFDFRHGFYSKEVRSAYNHPIHIGGQCNVAFMDGHVDAVTENEVVGVDWPGWGWIREDSRYTTH